MKYNPREKLKWTKILGGAVCLDSDDEWSPEEDEGDGVGEDIGQAPKKDVYHFPREATSKFQDLKKGSAQVSGGRRQAVKTVYSGSVCAAGCSVFI